MDLPLFSMMFEKNICSPVQNKIEKGFVKNIISFLIQFDSKSKGIKFVTACMDARDDDSLTLRATRVTPNSNKRSTFSLQLPLGGQCKPCGCNESGAPSRQHLPPKRWRAVRV